ncbi:MAG: hemolysin family protein [Prevotellaceae bacterium]|jgi:CBS domain containing-hemolysin-like protein|nr:hemolysin family protein [Prevotellaceae bacterium]
MEAMLIIAICSFILFAFFSATEEGLVSSNRLRKRQGKPSSYVVKLFAKNPTRLLTTTMTGSILSLTFLSLSTAFYIHPFIQQLIGSYFIGSLAITCIIIAIVIFILGDSLPKAAGKIKPNGFLRFFSIPITFFYIILFPIAKPLSWLSTTNFKAKRKRLGLEHQNPFEKRDPLRLADEVDKRQKNGSEELQHQQEIEMFRNALDFSEVRVGDCMTPRTEIEAIDINDNNFDELKQLFIDSGLSRLLIYDDSIDNVIGYIHSKDLFEKGKTIQQMIRPVEFIPENMHAQKLLTQFIKEQKAIAVVVDEFGGTMGLVTIEDILEEIIGDIDDEHDSDELVEKQISENHFILSGRLEVDDLNKSYNLNIPESDDYETIAGYIIYKNEQLPKPKETLVIDSFTIRILQMSSNKIDLIDLKVND